MIKKCLFPAAGHGTRFLPATKAMPKEMLPIVNKPLIQYGVEEAMQAGMTKIGIVTGRGKRALENHFRQNDATSVRWFRRAADQGLAIAQANLAWMYRFGRGVRQDHEEAAHWYRLAADQVFSVAQYHLGLMYENDWGVPQDRVESAIWCLKAAEQRVSN